MHSYQPRTSSHKPAFFCAVSLVLLISFSRAALAATSRCAFCHPKETERFLATPMGKSLISPEPTSPARIAHEPSQSEITIREQGDHIVHAISERGFTAEYAVRYQIGGGLMGASYMVQISDYLFESPASWYRTYGWDVSPGYEHAPLIDFDRAISGTCLFCHAGSVAFADTDGRRLQSKTLGSITCERCHGTAIEHVRRPSSRNVLNPARLPSPARESICEQCHLEGAARVLNPSKRWDGFRPGHSTEQTFATYVLRGAGGREVIAVSQVEQFAQSKCAQMSGTKLWCGTCHQAHGEPASDRGKQIRTVCTSCHTSLSAGTHPPAQAECTSCHMPRGSTTNISHAALTDHRILRRPAANAEETESAAPALTAWRQPPAEFRNRDLGMAEVLAGFSKNLPSIEEEGFHALEALPPRERDRDPDALSNLEGLSLKNGDLQVALQFGRRLVELRPQSAITAMNLGIVWQRAGNSAEAERQFNRAIELDPSLKQAYGELARLYAAEGRSRDMIGTLDRYLRWNPQDIMFRVQRAAAGQAPQR